MTEMGTLRELDVQAGDVVEFIEGMNGAYPEMVGKTFNVLTECDGLYINPQGATDDCESFNVMCSHTFKIVSRAKNEPKTDKFFMNVEPGYVSLANELYMAFEQSQNGKGKERHANDKPFKSQPLMEITRMVGPGGAAYQVMKKMQEAVGMTNRGEHDRAIAELHGAIIYAAACAMAIREKKRDV